MKTFFTSRRENISSIRTLSDVLRHDQKAVSDNWEKSLFDYSLKEVQIKLLLLRRLFLVEVDYISEEVRCLEKHTGDRFFLDNFH